MGEKLLKNWRSFTGCHYLWVIICWKTEIHSTTATNFRISCGTPLLYDNCWLYGATFTWKECLGYALFWLMIGDEVLAERAAFKAHFWLGFVSCSCGVGLLVVTWGQRWCHLDLLLVRAHLDCLQANNTKWGTIECVLIGRFATLLLHSSFPLKAQSRGTEQILSAR